MQILWLGTLIGTVGLAVAWWAFTSEESAWRTIVMSTVVLLQIVEAHVSRSSSESVFRLSPLSNRALLGATVLILVLQALVVYAPPLHAIFGTAPLSAFQALVPIVAALFVLMVVEAVKWLQRPAARG